MSDRPGGEAHLRGGLVFSRGCWRRRVIRGWLLRRCGGLRLSRLTELIDRLLEGDDVSPAGIGEPAAGLQLLDAARLPEPNPLLPLLLFGFDARAALADVATALARHYPADHRVMLHLRDGGSFELDLELLPKVAPGEPLALYVPPLPPEQALASPHGLRAIVHRLRAPGGCPWDREQTPASLARYVLEEAYEVVDAIQRGTAADLREELGDLLLQVYLQAEIAEESGDFDLSDVVRALTEKLIRRHPHVFGSVEVASAADVERNWEQLKEAERQASGSALERIPRSLPALARAVEVQRQLSRAGFDWPRPEGAWAKLDEELEELRAALGDLPAMEQELGDLLFMVAKVGRDAGIDPEAALRGTIERVIGRYAYLERTAEREGRTVGELGIERLLDLWQAAKQAERSDSP